MPDRVELTPDGLFSYTWNGKKKKTIRRRAKKLTVCTLLRCVCDITEGTTLQDIFDTVDRYRFLKMVVSQYSWCRSIDEFHAQAKEIHVLDDEDKDEKIEYLEIYHHVETNESNERIKHPGGLRERIKTVDFECSPCFHGVGTLTKDGETKKQNFSVSYSPMWKIAHLPIKTNKNFDVYTRWDSSQPKKEPEKVLSSEREFTLLEILDAIYWDISFMGGPQENAAFIDDLDQQVSDIKSGKVATIPWEQVSKRLGIKDETEASSEDGEKKLKIVLHPDVAQFLGVNPDEIPLDDKEIIRPDEKDEE